MRCALVTLLLAGPAVAIYFSARATSLLAYSRSLIGGGELWRLITCHWTHWTLDHLRWDLLAFAVLVPLCWRLSPSRLLGALAASSVLIPAAVWLVLPRMVEYRGLSGLDSALFVLLGVSLLREELAAGSRVCAAVFGLALLGFAGKIAFELVHESTLFVAGSEFVPVPLAHVVGGLCGLFFALWPASSNETPAVFIPPHRSSLGYPTFGLDPMGLQIELGCRDLVERKGNHVRNRRAGPEDRKTGVRRAPGAAARGAPGGAGTSA